MKKTEITENNLLNVGDLSQKYSVLGGIIAPKRSAFAIQGMANPLAQKQVRALDTSPPSLRDNTATSRFNDFNPYNNMPRKSPEIIRNNMAVRQKVSPQVMTLNVNTFQPTGSPILQPSPSTWAV